MRDSIVLKANKSQFEAIVFVTSWCSSQDRLNFIVTH